MMEETDFGPDSYVDYSGVDFFGPPTIGFWFTRFPVSDRYLVPLFSAKLTKKWNSLLQSWEDAGQTVEVSKDDISEIIQALSEITVEDLATICIGWGCSPEDCLHCASQLNKFLNDRLANQEPIFAETI